MTDPTEPQDQHWFDEYDVEPIPGLTRALHGCAKIALAIIAGAVLGAVVAWVALSAWWRA